MKNNKKLLSKFLTIILSTMMIFSSVLVVNTNVVFALEGEETTEEVAPEKEETVIEEIVDNGNDNTIIDEGSYDTTKVDEAQEEPVVVNEDKEEEIEEVKEFSQELLGIISEIESLPNEEGIQAIEDKKEVASLRSKVASIKNKGSNLQEEELSYFNDNYLDILNNTNSLLVERLKQLNEKPAVGSLGGDILRKLKGLITGKNVVTFKHGLLTLKTTNNFDYSNVENGAGIPKPTTSYTPTKKTGATDDPYLLGWYKRSYNILGLCVKETKWNFTDDSGKTPNKVNSSITLYAKYLGDFDQAFDFRVKHAGSNVIDIDGNGKINGTDEQAKLEEWLESHTTGEYIKFDDGYLYSYYAYYEQDFEYGLLANIIDNFRTKQNFDKVKVQKYNYVRSNNQVVSAVIQSINDIDPNKTGAITNADLNKDNTVDSSETALLGKNYEIVEEEYMCDFNGDGTNEKCILINIGDYYEGNAFDLAIQQANEGDTIQLLDHMYITKPIEIWGNVNLDLNGKTIVFNENSVCLDVIHHGDDWFRKSDIIIAKDICAAIYCHNVVTTISNGTIYNFHSSGKGVLTTSAEPPLTTTIKDLEIHVPDGNNAIESGAYDFDEVLNISGVTPGYINVLSGKIDGYIKNNGNGDLKINGETTYEVVNNVITNKAIYTGVKFTKDPRTVFGGADSNVLISNDYQVWSDGSDGYQYYVDVKPEAELNVNGTTKQYKNLETALYIYKNGSYTSGTITLLKDREQNGKILPIDVNGNLQINFNGKKITDGHIEVQNGNVILYGNGYVDSVRYRGGNVYIQDGHYSNLVYDTTTQDKEHIYVSGGFFKKKVPTDLLDKDSGNYKCVYSDMPGYQYQVVPEGEVQQVELYLNNGTKVDNSKYPGLVNALKAINEGLISADEVRLIRNITVNDTITINKPIVLNMKSHSIILNLELNEAEEIPEVPLGDDQDYDYFDSFDFDFDYEPVEPVGDIFGFYIEIDDSNKNVVIENGNILNNSKVEDENPTTIYGVYNKNTNLQLDNFKMFMNTGDCGKLVGIDNDLLGICELKNNSFIGTIDGIYAPSSVETFEGIVNDGTLTISDLSHVDISCANNTQSIIGINNSGTLNIINATAGTGANVAVSSTSSTLADTYGIKNSGNVYVDNGIVSVINNQGNIYGIYGSNNSIDEAKQIVLKNGATISITKRETSTKNAYGVYVATPNVVSSVKAEPMNITLGRSKIVVGTRDKAYGICSYGGRVVAATINNSVIESAILNSSDNRVPDVAKETNAAEIIINGGNGSVGIDSEYVDDTGLVNPSQLANTYISMEKSPSGLYGDNVYCIKSGTGSIGVNIYDGYYSNLANGKIFTSNVNAFGGYYSKSVTPATGYICVELAEKIIHKNANYSISNDYSYTIISDKSSMTAKVPDNKGSFEVIISVKYDPYMLDNPSKYGVIIESEAFGSKRLKFSIADSLKNIPKDVTVTSDYPFEYRFTMPAKNISEKFSIYIVDFEEEQHIYRSVKNYSIEAYCYTVLKTVSSKTGKFSFSQLQRELVATMLNYGSYAQLYFDNSLDPNTCANRNLGNYFTDDTKQNRFSKSVVYNSELEAMRDDPNDYSEVFERLAHSISLDTESYGLEFAFELVNSLQNQTVTFYCNGEPVEPEVKDGLWYIDVNSIATRELSREFEIEIKTGGKTYLMEYALLDYIYDANKLGCDDSLKHMLNALYEYYLIVQRFVIK